MASGTRSKKMSIDEDIKIYFENLIKPLATNDFLKETLNQFKDEIVTKFERKIQEQDERITQLESNLALRQNTINVLLDNLEQKSDDNEQYSRRSCLRIHGVEWLNEGEGEDINKTLSECFEKVNVSLDSKMIDRVHRIGKSYIDKQSGKCVKSIIVKFGCWDARTNFYKARPKSFLNGKKKPGQTPFQITLDLTKRRYDLLKLATGIIKENPQVLYAFADTNCSLAIKSANNKYYYFNSERELHDIIKNL